MTIKNLRIAVILIILQLLFSNQLFSQYYRGFNQEEINQIFLYQNPVIQILGGYLPGDISISEDGNKMCFTVTNDDIKSNSIYIMNTDGSDLREVPTPYGFKSVPSIIGRNLYFNYSPSPGKKAKAKAKGRKKGRYLCNLDNSKEFELVYKNIVSYTTYNQQSYFRPEKSGRRVEVQLLKNEDSYLKPYEIAKNIKPDYREINLDKEKKYFYLGLIQENKTKYNTDFFIYRSQNKPGSNGEIFIPGGTNPSMGMTDKLKNILIYQTLISQNKHKRDIYARNVKTGKNYYLVYCAEEIYCDSPLFSPVDNRFYFTAKYKKTTGLFLSWLNDPDKLKRAPVVLPVERVRQAVTKRRFSQLLRFSKK